MPPTPSVKSFIIADQAFRQAESNKWCIIGIFDAIWSSKFPATPPSLAVFLQLSDAYGEYAIRVDFEDSEGRCLAKMQGITMKVHDKRAHVEVGIQGFNLPLPKPDTYFLKVYFNDELASTDIKLKVLTMEEPKNA